MVMKGCQKRIIVMKNTGSNLFDEAYFILKDSAVRSPSISEQDMVGEAARIIAENMIVSERRDTKPRRRSGDPELYMLLLVCRGRNHRGADMLAIVLFYEAVKFYGDR